MIFCHDLSEDISFISYVNRHWSSLLCETSYLEKESGKCLLFLQFCLLFLLSKTSHSEDISSFLCRAGRLTFLNFGWIVGRCGTNTEPALRNYMQSSNSFIGIMGGILFGTFESSQADRSTFKTVGLVIKCTSYYSCCPKMTPTNKGCTISIFPVTLSFW